MSETNIPEQDTAEQLTTDTDTAEHVTINQSERVTKVPFIRVMIKPAEQLSKAEFEDGLGRFMLYAGMMLGTFLLVYLISMINL